jgi:hypothetical protein
VGLSPALRTAFDLLRPFGVISSIGVHNAEVSFVLESDARESRADQLVDSLER